VQVHLDIMCPVDIKSLLTHLDIFVQLNESQMFHCSKLLMSMKSDTVYICVFVFFRLTALCSSNFIFCAVLEFTIFRVLLLTS